MEREVKASALGSAAASELFQLLRDGQPRTRAELSTVTGLARSTVALRLDALRDLDLIRPFGAASSSGGRPPSQYALNPSARVVIGADLGASHATIGIADLSGAILISRRTARPIAEGPDVVLAWFAHETRALLAELDRAPADILAVGMGLPGPVEHTTGRPINPPIMPGWDGIDVPARVMHEFGVNALVDNDVNIMAIGEQSRAFPTATDVLFVKVATGVGAGIISGGILQRGAQGSAGDIGHVRIERGAGVACRCGNFGCLEAMASGPAIAAQLRASGTDVESIGDVFDLVRAGDLDAIRAVRQAGKDIGEVLATCVSLINPSIIVLGGSVSRIGEHLLAGVREVVYQRASPLASQHLSIVKSQSNEDAGVIGASILALQYALSPESIDEMSAGSSER